MNIHVAGTLLAGEVLLRK